MKKITSILLLSFWCFSSCQQKENARPQTHNDLMDALGKPTKEIKTVGILLYDGYTTLDAMGPYQVLSEMMGTQVFFVAKHAGLVSNMNGMKVEVTRSFADTDSLDVLVIPGGLRETYQAAQDTAILNWIRKIDATTTYTASVCTGAWILEATGLLKDKQVTTHWWGKTYLREKGVNVQDKRWVRDGKYWTSAGVTAGMDMSLAMIADIRGEKYAKTAMLDLEYDPQPPFAGGSEHNTDKEIVDIMRQMYDIGMESAVNSPAQSVITLASTIDPVCNMSVATGHSDTTLYKNNVYGFCSHMCKESFVKEPERYLSKK
ncbi:MAG: DJ-1/PfpI family protein [Flavobacterium sp.]|jgi:putative intracellular protease/amidase/YHS domain-containing protein